MQYSLSFYSTKPTPNFSFPSSVYNDHTLVTTLCENNSSNDFKFERNIIVLKKPTLSSISSLDLDILDRCGPPNTETMSLI
ncbi:hypothetical protein VNO77_44089 [Canavalia gladiata]|uniref:Uncharacterized protein n=1 Tax=Canavalia gladiata TaxID=3824 RepID=A0AAN9JXX1_CANGL